MGQVEKTEGKKGTGDKKPYEKPEVSIIKPTDYPANTTTISGSTSRPS